MELVFASGNENKVLEVAKKLGGTIPLKGLRDIGCTTDLPETSETLEGNARQKARYVWDHFKVNCFADDTGLEVTALNMEPGVYSARYAGEQRSASDNMQLLLENLKSHTDRSARFRTVICLIIEGEEFLFEGMVQGSIRQTPSGNEGFGYDPIFEPAGYAITFAEMSLEEKNIISHRGKAIAALRDFLTARTN
ncbi:MAG: RdgB/HAM1 family non-canonical purine NTP pyrophosphatase [Flavobacteriales bacterium]|jgi:XTP/dITP diphosphohydrolase